MCIAKPVWAVLVLFVLVLTSVSAISVSANTTMPLEPEIDVPDSSVCIGFQKKSTGEMVTFPFRNTSSQREELVPALVDISDMFDGYFTVWGTFVIEGVKEEYSDQSIDIILPSNVFRIAERAFAGTSFQSIEFNDDSGLQYIDAYAFREASIRSIELPASLVHIAEGAFLGSGLESVRIPASMTVLEPYTFARCENLSEADFSECTSIEIGEACFFDSPVFYLYFPDGNVTIGAWAFSYSYDGSEMEWLINVMDGGKEIHVGESAFRNRAILDFPLFSAVEIGDYGFYGCSFYFLTEADFSILKRLGAFAFSSCSLGLYGNGMTFHSLEEMGEGAFYAAYGFADVDFGDSPLEEIPSNAFRDSSITNVYFSEKTKRIGNAAFGGCYNMTIVEFPSSLVSIGDFAFYGSGLYDVVLPEGLQSIGAFAFADNSLTFLVLPSRIVAIAGKAFSGNSLSSIVMNGHYEDAYIDQSAFDMFYIEDGEVVIKDEFYETGAVI